MTLPKDFTEYTQRLFGPELWERYVQALAEPAPVSVRLNPFKTRAEEWSAESAEDDGQRLSALRLACREGDRVPWCRDAYWLRERPQFTLDPLMHAGLYYVQEAGSMFLDSVLQQYVRRPVLMLDLCAAPGGKSTLARAALPEGSLLMSNEPDRRRANILVENIQKQGHGGVMVTSDYAEAYARTRLLFDVVLTDVPCSGEGLFRRDAAAVGEWSTAAVRRCADLQRHIVSTIWPCLRPGGLLIYSTCTFNTHEDEENVRFITDNLGAEALSVETADTWHITGSLLPGYTAPIYRFIPGTTRSEGLFMAVVRKRGATTTAHAHAAAREGTPRNAVAIKEKDLATLHVLYDGHPHGERKGRDTVPAHAEAIAATLDRDRYPMAELPLADALRYLRREALVMPPGTPKGYVVVTHCGHPLGFVKNLGTRANNLYPKEWAIRQAIRPQDAASSPARRYV